MVLAAVSAAAMAQSGFGMIRPDGTVSYGGAGGGHSDGKDVPKGLKVWTVDGRFGDIAPAQPDTLPHMFQNTIFTTGLRGVYNTTGNLGAPRISRVFADREMPSPFFFTDPYDYFVVQPWRHHFTNTLSPVTNLSYNTCGDRLNGEDHLKAKFAVNAGKKIGAGFIFDYIYGRGYYNSQSTAHFNYTMYGSYLGDRYQAHLLVSANHQKVAENGGIADDNYITHPEQFTESYTSAEIPTLLSQNWNRNDNQHIFLTHRLSAGFNRKVPMTSEEIEAKKYAMEAKREKEEREAKEKAAKDDLEGDRLTFGGRPEGAAVVGDDIAPADTTSGGRVSIEGFAKADSIAGMQTEEEWMKKEYVPVTSFIHTLSVDNYRRIYQAYSSPPGYYAYSYGTAENDSVYDRTDMLRIRNTVAVSLLEGFNKWAKAGLKVFATSDLRRYTLPGEDWAMVGYTEHSLSVGGQISKAAGRTLHYKATAEAWLAGPDAGGMDIGAEADLNVRLFGDTATLRIDGFARRTAPNFYLRRYNSAHYRWENGDLGKVFHTRVQGRLEWRKTRTSVRVAVDELSNYAYLAEVHSQEAGGNRFAHTAEVRRKSGAMTLFTAQLSQDFTLGPLNWENVVTFQKSTDMEALPVPAINAYTNLYLKFKIAKVLSCELGADAVYFTSYNAPGYVPGLGQYAVQGGDYKVGVGNYPIVNAYANFHLKQTRFFVMMSHVNAGMGDRHYFLVPHHPINDRTLRFGLSWNFFN